ncbi:hypothetical protein COCOBI_07-5820 [Coccomyxa sp. Obi]|nr:hypothetical protein COCOBI_07-5820 [Coccomyxa sp. Obi]
MKLTAITFTFAVLFVVAGARSLQQAPAPAPASSSKPVADLLFIFSADNASFQTSTTLELQGATSTVQFYGAGARAGVILTPNFLNSSLGAPYVAMDGNWLNTPDAALHGSFNGTHKAVLMSLSSPQYNPASKTVTFNITVLETKQTALRTTKGVANELVAEALAGSDMLMPLIEPGTVLTDVALFIDENKAALEPMAETKTWWWWWGPGWGWGWGGCGWGCGWYGKK